MPVPGAEDRMQTQSSSGVRLLRQAWRPLRTASAIVAAGWMISCGGGNSTPKFSGNTLVSVVISGTANDQLTEFDMGIQGLTLTSQAGSTVTLLSTLQGTEFIHLNGGIEPLVSASIPQGVYTSATATMNGADFSCVTLTPQGGIDTTTFSPANGANPIPADITINLAAPITVTGNSMALVLNLQVAQSAAYSSCYFGNNNVVFAITPTFNLTPAIFSTQPTNASNGKALGVIGQVTSIDAASESFVLAYPELDSRTANVTATAGTAYQGINSFAGLALGTLVDLDGAVQPDGSLVATRIEAEDVSATSEMRGPLLFVDTAEPVLSLLAQREQGSLFSEFIALGFQDLSFGNAAFHISGQLANLDSLPFAPSFDAANMVAGQNVYAGTTATSFEGGPNYTPLTSLTLIPQTIDGTVSGSSTAGNFTVYAANLASYDLFPTLAVQAAQTTLLNNPSEVEVYVDSSTQLLNSQSLGPGGTFRFYGLVFNDHGTLRMDCAQVTDGPSLAVAANVAMQNRMVAGRLKAVRNATIGAVRQTSRVITPAN
jgi:hypothetical protein